jgi:hypothetical protein
MQRLGRFEPTTLAECPRPATQLWRAANVMTLEHGAAEADVKIRTPRHVWIWTFVAALTSLALAAVFLWIDHVVITAVYFLVLSGAIAALGLRQRSFGVDLTRESAIVRGRRNVPWQEVQAVDRYVGRRGVRGVQLILQSGKAVNLPAPTSSLGLGAAQFERDFHRIDQWWQAHRGDSWRPAPVETPPPTVQG